MVRARRPALFLVLAAALLAAGCAFRRGDPLPEEPPGDFTLEVRVRDAASWPWDGRVALGREGVVTYDVVFKDPPSNRRGSAPLEDAARAAAWAAVVEAGFFDREPVAEGEAAGPVVVEGLALGLEGRWSGDPEVDSALAALLQALRPAVPVRAFRPLPADRPPK